MASSTWLSSTITRHFPRSAHALTTVSTCSTTPSRRCFRGGTVSHAAAAIFPSPSLLVGRGSVAARRAPGSVSSPRLPRGGVRPARGPGHRRLSGGASVRGGWAGGCGHPGPGCCARLAQRRSPAPPWHRASPPHLGRATAGPVRLPGGTRHDRHPAIHCQAAHRSPHVVAAGAGPRLPQRPVRPDARQHLRRDQIELAPLVTGRPEVHPLAARASIAGQQFRTLPGRADTDPPAKLRRVPPDQGTYDLGQDTFGIRNSRYACTLLQQPLAL